MPSLHSDRIMTKKVNRIVKTFLGYKDVLTAALLRLSVQPVDVDDILQETLTRALEADKHGPIKYPQSYLYKVSRNMVFREQQRRAREVQSEIDEAAIVANAAGTDEAVYYKQTLQVFLESMASLPKAHQRAILLRRVYGLSQKEVAQKMGVSLSSVEKYFAQGIKRCQELMAARGFELTPVDKTSPKKSKQHSELETGNSKGKSIP
jgi:RNA polymerase sigma factor (sigma-70 family)